MLFVYGFIWLCLRLFSLLEVLFVCLLWWGLFICLDGMFNLLFVCTCMFACIDCGVWISFSVDLRCWLFDLLVG